MFNLIGTLKNIATRFPSIMAMVWRMHFAKELAAHRKRIQPYRAQGDQKKHDYVVETALLIGYFEVNLGLGEYARGLATALEAAGLPFSIYPYNAYTGRLRNEAPWARLYDVDEAHSVNIFCMAPNQTKNARRIIGRRHTEKSYNILSTFWELQHAPESWRSDLDFFDELWAPNHFVANSFRQIFSKRILIMPPCVDVGVDITPNRAKFGLDPTKFYFVFSFDRNSYIERKNPLAVANAFSIAFDDGRDDVGLIFKLSGSQNPFPKTTLELEAIAARDRRIAILQGDWQRADVLALMASVDCFVSLHRSEGFGLGMAEAMFLGKPVIGTAFSGNTDFLTGETGYPVPYQMRAVEQGEYPYSAGNSWAEPDVRIAAEMMRSVASRTDEVRSKALRGQSYVKQHYSPKAVGRVVAARLRELTGGASSSAKPISTSINAHGLKTR
jgi:glycosyltransferase involved in cell wall biosynthesis